ncbi:RNA 2',3'-cyclic phosphodiesterase [Candidatus Omnitrophota bacterium]
MRCFAAIKLSDQVRAEVVRIQRGLRPLDLHAKWVEPENLHVTLKFLGEIREDDLPQVRQIVAGISSFAHPFGLRLFGLGVFPDARRPRVLWAGIRPQDNPLAIIEYLEYEFSGMGILREKRSPHPHITLARIKSPKNTGELEGRLSDLRVEELEWEVQGVSLFKSLLKPSGPAYEEIFTAILTA